MSSATTVQQHPNAPLEDQRRFRVSPLRISDHPELEEAVVATRRERDRQT